MNTRHCALLPLLVLVLCGACAADEVILTNGRVVRGEVVSKPGADPLVLDTPAGKVRLPRRLVKEVVRTESAPPTSSPSPGDLSEADPPGDLPESVPRPERRGSSGLSLVTPLPDRPALPDARQLSALLARGATEPRSLTLAGIVYEDGRGVAFDHARAVELYRRAASAGDELAMSRLAFAYIQGSGVAMDWAEAKRWGLAAAQRKDPFGVALVTAWRWSAEPYDVVLAAERYLEAARSGDTRAYYFVAKYKGRGSGFPRCPEDSARWYARGAELGEPGCMDQHASNLANGRGLPLDLAEARRWAGRARAHGDALGTVKFAVAHRLGWGAAPEPAKAIEILQGLLERPLNAGTAAASYQLGQTYRLGWGVAVDFPQARRYLAVAVRLGHDDACAALGYLYFKAQGGPQDLAAARKLWETAARDGNTWSIQNLAYRAREGAWGPADEPEARRLFQRAARLGDAVSMFELGVMSFHGQGGPADRPGGMAWLEKAANAGHAAAATEVGRCYAAGWLGEVDLPRARRAYQRAAEGGDLTGAHCYAWMLAHGTGGPADPVTALRLLERGAAQKHPYTLYNLGLVLLKGLPGIPADPVRGQRLIEEAARLGEPTAAQELRARGW